MIKCTYCQRLCGSRMLHLCEANVIQISKILRNTTLMLKSLDSSSKIFQSSQSRLLQSRIRFVTAHLERSAHKPRVPDVSLRRNDFLVVLIDQAIRIKESTLSAYLGRNFF
jgi:hypothetical protein